MNDEISPELLERLKEITGKRSKIVVDHIVKHGYITTEELKNLYGYDHPPRAIRDVREQGIPLLTFKVESATTGRKIAAYRFGDPLHFRAGRIGGRAILPKSLKKSLITKFGSRSALTGEKLEPRYLQIDHRIPYEIAGNEADVTNPDAFMLLDAASQRAKN
jgi:hypothetical protein